MPEKVGLDELDEKLIRGEISEETYLELKEKIEAGEAPEKEVEAEEKAEVKWFFIIPDK